MVIAGSFTGRSVHRIGQNPRLENASLPRFANLASAPQKISMLSLDVESIYPSQFNMSRKRLSEWRRAQRRKR